MELSVPTLAPAGQPVWSGKELGLSALAILILVVLWESAPSIGGPLLFAAVFLLLLRARRKGILPSSNQAGSMITWGAALLVLAVIIGGMASAVKGYREGDK